MPCGRAERQVFEAAPASAAGGDRDTRSRPGSARDAGESRSGWRGPGSTGGCSPGPLVHAQAAPGGLSLHYLPSPALPGWPPP